MRLVYVLLSPTWGMHQYTADLANRMGTAGHEVHLVTTSRAPLDRYAPRVHLHTPVDARDSGFSTDGLRHASPALKRGLAAIRDLHPSLVHFTGPHLWNPLLLRALRREGIPTVHSLHDLHPHAGAVYGRLLYGWNGWVRREADHLLVHGQRYRTELMAQGVAPERVTCTMLTHGFAGYEQRPALDVPPSGVRYEAWALFMGRLQPYKGLDVLVQAARLLEPQGLGVVVAGEGRRQSLGDAALPANVTVHGRLADDQEAEALFRRCGLVVLPYIEASQSALVAAAYSFRKPVIITRVGALPEYVVDGETGWVIPPGDARALAGALSSALADPARLDQMGNAGWTWYQAARAEEGAALRQLYVRLVRDG